MEQFYNTALEAIYTTMHASTVTAIVAAIVVVAICSVIVWGLFLVDSYNSLVGNIASLIAVAAVFSVIAALIVADSAPVLLCSKQTFLDTYQLNCDGIRLWHGYYDKLDFSELKQHLEPEGYYLYETNAVQPMGDISSSKERTCILIPSEIYDSVQFEELLTSRPMYCYMGIEFKVTPKEGKSELNLCKNTRKSLLRANDLVFLIGYDMKLFYSEEEACGAIFKYILDGTYDTAGLIDKLASVNPKNYSFTAPDNLPEIEQEILVAENKAYTNEITPSLIKENWGKQELFLFEDGSTLNIKLDDTLKYIPDDKSIVVFNNNIPTEIHYAAITKDSSDSHVNIEVTNDINVKNITEDKE